jgi:glyoxylase-like metal-dependent hydrolase (beta-lactamase superfamily II)
LTPLDPSSAVRVLGGAGEYDIAASEPPTPGKKLCFPVYNDWTLHAGAREIDTEYAIGNPNSQTASFDLTFYSSSGNIISTNSHTLGQCCLLVGDSDDIFFSSDTGHAEIYSDKDLVGGWRVVENMEAEGIARTQSGGPAQVIE